MFCRLKSMFLSKKKQISKKGRKFSFDIFYMARSSPFGSDHNMSSQNGQIQLLVSGGELSDVNQP